MGIADNATGISASRSTMKYISFATSLVMILLVSLQTSLCQATRLGVEVTYESPMTLGTEYGLTVQVTNNLEFSVKDVDIGFDVPKQVFEIRAISKSGNPDELKRGERLVARFGIVGNVEGKHDLSVHVFYNVSENQRVRQVEGPIQIEVRARETESSYPIAALVILLVIFIAFVLYRGYKRVSRLRPKKKRHNPAYRTTMRLVA